MAPTRRSDPPNANASKSGPSWTARPSRVMAGKGGHVAQLQKTAFVIEQAQHASEQSKDLLHDEPINKMAPTLRRPRKKKTGKKPAKDTAMVNNVDSDPFGSDSQPIAKSRPDSRFGLQPRGSGFVGRQTLQDYKKDHPKNSPVVCPGNGGVHHKAWPPTNSNDGGNRMAIDNEGSHRHHSEVRDHGHQMDVDRLPGSLFDFDNGQVIQDVIRGQDYQSARENHEDQIIHDLASQDDIRVQPPHHCAQQAPPQPSNLSRHSSTRDSTQPHRHVSNTERLQEHALPSPPISRSNSNRGDKHDHDNGTQVSSAVHRGDEHADTDYDLLGRKHSSNPHRKSLSRTILPVFETALARRECVATGTISQPNQVPVVQHNHVAAPPSRAQNDNAAAVNEVPAARQLQGPVEHNHAASSNLTTEGGYDDKRRDMATLLYDDLGSFHSVIKKTAQEAIASGYPVHAPTTVIPREARMVAIKEQVTSLLQDANYLHGVPNEHGKRAYFSHPVLRQICLSVFYASSRKSLHTFLEFQQSVPVKVLALVHFVLTVYKKHGRDTNPSLNAKELEVSYYRFLQSLQGVIRHHSKGP
ncbi:hypothetical protein JVT61DRAFT_12077 [Boletus reticuloceps]|uniref:DUF6532 domain-containing protein n=1 Tax=Boletus reticuloceps TaxID=495285 RepID=A0A8I2YEP1_9AGAM|nr:hypothetical protein JVT61DRAFT_12077 [Boletus reticuloceps]